MNSDIAQRRGGRKSKAIANALKEKMGISNADVWYEPIHGPCFEMSGYMGGWYYKDLDTGHFNAIGYNFQDAMEFIDLSSR